MRASTKIYTFSLKKKISNGVATTVWASVGSPLFFGSLFFTILLLYEYIMSFSQFLSCMYILLASHMKVLFCFHTLSHMHDYFIVRTLKTIN